MTPFNNIARCTRQHKNEEVTLYARWKHLSCRIEVWQPTRFLDASSLNEYRCVVCGLLQLLLAEFGFEFGVEL